MSLFIVSFKFKDVLVSYSLTPDATNNVDVHVSYDLTQPQSGRDYKFLIYVDGGVMPRLC